MSTFKDLLYNKNNDETWAEWTKRVPDNDEDKLDYIGETIYAKIYNEDKEKAGKITGMLLNIGVEDLIPLLESNELLDEKIKEAYEIYREFEEYKMSEEDYLSAKEEWRAMADEEKEKVIPVITLTVAEMIEALSKLPPDAKLVMTESGFYSNSEFAEVMLPRPYKVANDRFVSDLPTGTQVYIIGHSHQSY